MEWLAEATAFDVLVLVIFLAFLVRGIWVGFIRQISSLIAMLGGFLLAGYFDNEFYSFLLPYFNNSHTAFLITYILLFVAFFFLQFIQLRFGLYDFFFYFLHLLKVSLLLLLKLYLNQQFSKTYAFKQACCPGCRRRPFSMQLHQ